VAVALGVGEADSVALAVSLGLALALGVALGVALELGVTLGVAVRLGLDVKVGAGGAINSITWATRLSPVEAPVELVWVRLPGAAVPGHQSPIPSACWALRPK
jgi:hypothetical protein